MKFLKVVGTVVGVVALAATGIGLALGGPLAAGWMTIGAVAGIAGGLIGVGTALFAPKPTFSTSGNPLNFQTNPQSALPYPVGRTRMSGVRIHGETYDSPTFASESKQDVLSFAVLLGAGGPMEEIESFRADKEVVTFDGTTGNAIGTHADYMAQKTSLGLAGASALALTFGAVAFPGWTTDHKLTGIAHALWDLRYDSKGDHFGAGVPEPEWIMKGALAYDPRLDSTYPGGSGSHVALDESTYEWTNNPALIALTWCLGRWQNGKRTLGIGAPVANIRVADFVEAANVAEANEWTCGGVEWSTDSKWSVLKRMLQAGGAEPTMTGAMIGCRVNTPRISIATVTADKLLDSLSMATTRSRRDRFNSVIPRYRSEDHDWEVISGSTVTVSDYVTEDGGVRTKEIDFPLVQHETGGTGNDQAGQLAAYEIVNSREAGPIRFTTGPEFIGVKTGDVITLDVPDEGLDEQPVLIRSRSIDPTSFKITFEAETETDAKHDFALGKTTTPPPTYEPTPPDLTPPTPDSALWELTAAAGWPAITIAGVCEFPGADSVILEYKKTADSDWLTLGKAEASAPVVHTVTGLDALTEYEARVAYQSGNRIGPWLTLDPVTTSAYDLVALADDFYGSNNQNDDPIDPPTFDGPPFTHKASPGGGVDLTVHWEWTGDEESIDGFLITGYIATPEEGARTYNFRLDILGAQALYIREDGARAYMSAESGHILEYELLLRDEMGTVNLLNDFDLSAVLSGSVRGISFSPDGLNMYIAEFAVTPRIRRYELSTAWDLSTATHSQNLTTVQAEPTGVAISPDGTRLYYVGHDVGGGDSEISEVPLGTPWDLSTAGTAVTEDVSSHFETVTDLHITADGENVFLCGQTATFEERVKHFTMDAFDVSTLAYASKLRDVEDMQSLIRGLDFTRDGLCMMVIDENDLVRCYEMETAYDIENAVDPPNEPGTFGNDYVFGSNVPREFWRPSIKPSERSYTLANVSSDSYYTIGIYAYRKVDPGVEVGVDADGVILSTLEELAPGSGFLPYRPQSAAVFQSRVGGVLETRLV